MNTEPSLGFEASVNIINYLQLGHGVIMQQIPYARAPACNIKVKQVRRHDGLMTPSFEAVEIKKHL